MELLLLTGSSLTLALIGFVIFLIISYHYLTRPTVHPQYPPGPIAFPLLGNLPQIALCGSMSKFCEKYRKIYGNVFTIELLGRKSVVISGLESFNQLLIKNGDITSTRSSQLRPDHVRERLETAPGLLYAPYPMWKKIRTFSILQLREAGMGKSAFEPQILEEVECYMTHFIKPNHDKPMDLSTSLSLATFNIIAQLLFNKRFEYDDGRNKSTVLAMNVAVGSVMKLGLVSQIPFHLKIFKSVHAQFEKTKSLVENQIRRLLRECKLKLEEGYHDGLLGTYLKNCQATANKDSDCFSGY